MVELSCFQCQTRLQLVTPISFREECSKCRSDVHVCKNCQHYDEKIYNQCKEPQAERTLVKDRSNRCEFFVARGGSQSKSEDVQARVRAAAEALFKKT